MEPREIIDLIEKYISENKTKEAIKCLSSCQLENGGQEVILLKSRFIEIQKATRMGVLPREEANRELRQINLAVLELTQFIASPEKETKVLPGQLDKTIAKSTTTVGAPNFQLDQTLDKKVINLNTNANALSAIELETTDRRVQNSEGVFRIETSALIGRHPDCDIIILDQGVSRQHTRIFRQGNQLIVSDENSTNGTFWNNQPISQMVITESGTLRLDEVKFKLRVIKKR